MPGGSGAMFQLAARGKEDLNIYSLKDPTPFKAVYKKYSHFSMQDHYIPFNTNINFGQICKVTIPNLGDLIGNNLFINIKFPKISISYKNSIQNEILNIRNDDGTSVIKINNIEEFKKFLLNTVDINNIFSNHSDVSKINNVFGVINLYNNFLVFQLSNNRISYNFNHKLYYSNTIGYIEHLFFKQRELMKSKEILNSHTIKNSIISSLKDSLLFIENPSNLDTRSNVNLELSVYHEYYYKISQNLNFEENAYASKFYTVTIAGEISAAITYNLYGLISTTDTLLGDIIEINQNNLKIKLPILLYDINNYTIIFICNKECSYTSSITLNNGDKISNGELELTISNVSGSTITFSLTKIPTSSTIISNTFLTENSETITLSGFNYQFYTVSSTTKNNSNIENDIVTFFKSLSTTDFKSLFITMMDNSLTIPFWFYYQFYSKIFSNTNNTTSTNNMISRIITMDRTTYDLDTTKSTLEQDLTKFGEFSKNFNTLYLNSSNTSYSIKNLNTGDSNFTTLINTNLNAYKNQILDDYSTNLANYLLTGNPNSLKDLFKTIAVYSTTSASVESVIYKIDITPSNGLFDSAAKVIIHSNFGDINISAANIAALARVEQGVTTNEIIISFTLQQILITMYDKKFDTNVLTTTEYNGLKIFNNATHYSFFINGTYMKLNITSRTEFMDTVLYTTDTYINDESLYVQSNVYYFTNFILCDFIYYLRNLFKTNFFNKITYTHQIELESRCLELYAKIRNKYMIVYLGMAEISTTGRLYLSEITDYYDLYDCQNIINFLTDRDNLTEIQLKTMLDSTTISSQTYNYSKGSDIIDIYKNNGNLQFPSIFVMYGNNISSVTDNLLTTNNYSLIDRNTSRIYVYSKNTPGDSVTLGGNNIYIKKFNNPLFKGIHYQVNEKLNVGTTTDYLLHNITNTKTYIFIKKNLSSNITEFKFRLGSMYFAKTGLTYVDKIQTDNTITVYKVKDSITFLDNSYHIDSLDDVNSLINDSTILSGYISDSTDSVTIDHIMIDAIDTYTQTNTDLDVIDGVYYNGTPGDNLNLLTKAEALSLFKTYLSTFKDNYSYYYILKHYETRNTSYFNFLRGFTENLETIGYTVDTINRYIEGQINFKLKTYQTTFSDNLTRYSYQNDNNLISNSIDMYKLIIDKIASYITNYSETNTIFNFERLVLNDKYYYSNYSLLSNLDSILYTGNTLISKYYSPNNAILKNIYNPIFLDQRKFITQTVSFIKDILLKKSLYDYVFLLSVYGYMPNVKLEEIIHTILNNQLYSSTNYSAELLSDEESSSVEFNTLFADKAIYKYKNTIMSFDEYTQAKIVIDKFTTDGATLVKEVLIREKYNSLPNICIDVIRNKTTTFNNTIYKQLQIHFEKKDNNTQYIENITFSNNGGYIAFASNNLTNFNSNSLYIKLYIGNDVYFSKLTISGSIYITTIAYNASYNITVSYGYHILKNIIVTTNELYDLKNSVSNESVSKINDEYKRTFQLPISLNLVGDQNNLLNLSLSRNFNKDKYLIINKMLLLAVTNFKKSNTTEITNDITYNNTNTSLSVSNIAEDLLMLFGDKMSGYGYYDTQLRMLQINKLEEKSTYNCNLYKMGLNKFDTGYNKFFDDSSIISADTSITLNDIGYDSLTITHGYDYALDTSNITIDSSGIYYMYNLKLNNNQNLSLEDSLILKNSNKEVGVNKIISVVDDRINLLTTQYISNPTNILNYSYTKIQSSSDIVEPMINDSITISNNNYLLKETDNRNLILKMNYNKNVSKVNIKLNNWYTTNITKNLTNNSIVLADSVLINVRKPSNNVLVNLANKSVSRLEYGIQSFVRSNNISSINYDPEPILKLFYNDSMLIKNISDIDNLTFKDNLGLTNTDGNILVLKIRDLFFKKLETFGEKEWYYDTHDLDYNLESNNTAVYTPKQTELITEQYNNLSNYRTYVKRSDAITNRDTTPKFKFVKNYGLNLIKNIKLKLGDFQISEYDSDYIYIFDKLVHKTQNGIKKMYGNDETEYVESSEGNFYIPVPWMFRNIPFPLIASPYTKLSLEVELNNIENLIITDDNNTNKVSSRRPKLFVLGNYYYLEPEQRKLFAEYRHEYLVEQVNRLIIPRPSFDLKVNDLSIVPIELGNPTKDIFFFFKSKENVTLGLLNNYGVKSGTTSKVKFILTNNVIAKQVTQEDVYSNPIKQAKIKFNGRDRMKYYDGSYYNDVVPYQYYNGEVDVGVNVYSFCLQPAQDYPTGSINLSYVDDMNLFLKLHTMADGNIHIYTRNYNILRLMSGQSGIIYLN
jgi:hypothetical protein